MINLLPPGPRWRLSITTVGLLVGITLMLGGCAGGAAPPPEDPGFLPEAEVLSLRASRDVSFKNDDDSPIPPEARAEFEALEYYDYDPGLRFLVRLERFDEPAPFTIVSTEGEPRPAVKMGVVRFDHDGQENQLTVYSLRDLPAEHWNSLFLPFLDTTSGSETYGAGRYVELANRGEDWYVLDFNTAYNPLCAYGRAIYRCPSTPAENRLKVAIRAGERGGGQYGAVNAEAERG